MYPVFIFQSGGVTVHTSEIVIPSSFVQFIINDVFLNDYPLGFRGWLLTRLARTREKYGIIPYHGDDKENLGV